MDNTQTKTGTNGFECDPDTTAKEEMKEKLGQFEETSENVFNENIDRPGTLLSDKIHFFAENYNLIWPYNSDHLRAAGYNLRVGDSYSKDGETHDLNEGDEIKIPPFQVAVVKTHEIVNMPRFLIGRLSIKVGGAHKGLLWVGGPHVDPGYVGHLFCPIYNLSSEEVRLQKGDEFGVIDFETTTMYNGGSDTEGAGGLKTYPRPPGNLILEDYEGAKLKSGLWTEAGQRLDNIEQDTEARVNQIEQDTEARLNRMEEDVDELGTIFYSSISGIFTVLAILIAALSIFVSAGSSSSEAAAGLSPLQLISGMVGVVTIFGTLVVLYVGLLKRI